MKGDIIIRKDGNVYMCVGSGFTDLQNSPSFWGDSPVEALEKYLKALNILI